MFGAAIHKASVSPNEPMEYAFEQVCNRFDKFLGRHLSGETQRGLIILDETTYETSLHFRVDGHRWGKFYDLADVPFFVNSKATRLIQYADLIAYALRRYYEEGDSNYFDIIIKKIRRRRRRLAWSHSLRA